MSCPEFRDLIAEYALGELAELSAAEKGELESHLADCAECEAELRAVRAFCDLMRPRREPTVPQESLERIPRNVMAAIRYRRRRRRLVRIGAFVAAGWAAAAAILVCVGAWRRLADDGHSTLSPPPVAVQSAPQSTPEAPAAIRSAATAAPKRREPTLEERFAAATDPTQALRLLLDSADAARNSADSATLEKIIALCPELVARWPGTLQALDAAWLISDCYTHLAEPDKARKAFVAYADAKGDLEKKRWLARVWEDARATAMGDKVAADTIIKEADRLFRQKDYVAALPYYELLHTRYPGAEASCHAQYMVAKYHEAKGQWAQASLLYARLRESSPDGKYSNRAAYDESLVLWKAGRERQALETLDTLAREGNEFYQIEATYLAGLLCMGRRGSQVVALRKFQDLAKKWPDTPRARDAKARLRQIQSSVVNSLGSGFGG